MTRMQGAGRKPAGPGGPNRACQLARSASACRGPVPDVFVNVPPVTPPRAKQLSCPLKRREMIGVEAVWRSRDATTSNPSTPCAGSCLADTSPAPQPNLADAPPVRPRESEVGRAAPPGAPTQESHGAGSLNRAGVHLAASRAEVTGSGTRSVSPEGRDRQVRSGSFPTGPSQARSLAPRSIGPKRSTHHRFRRTSQRASA